MLNEYLRIALSSVAVFIFIIVAIRVFGKNELAQLSVIDLVFILLISNSVQNAMVGANSSLSGGLVAAASLFLANYALKKITYRYPRLDKLIEGEALLLVYKGKVNEKNLSRAQLTREELMEAIREHGVLKVEDVDLAVLEVDGNISIISDGFKHQSVRKRKSHKAVTKTQ